MDDTIIPFPLARLKPAAPPPEEPQELTSTIAQAEPAPAKFVY